MDEDDRPVGRILGRREALKLLSAGGAAVFAAGAVWAGASASTPRAAVLMPSCIARPELTEGPYFTDVELDRSDIRAEPSTGDVRPGVPLALTFTVGQISAGACAPLPGARIDIWQCDAQGRYSAFQDRRAGFDTRDEKFLRGYQETDSAGVARFTTIYPGWYPGRAVHIHFKIRTPAGEGRTYEFTSQLFFDEALSGEVFASEPYLAKGDRYVPNAGDSIYRRAGEQLLLYVAPRDEGFGADFAIGLDLSDAATGRPD